VAFFHLMTHAFFKALLFLAAGSVIIGMHHEQDIRHMGGLWKKMPITWAVSLLGSLALIGAPLFSGFYSKDMIIEAVRASNLVAAPVVYLMLLLGVFVTAFYSFRMFFLVFHGTPRWSAHGSRHGHGHDDGHHGGEPHESPWVVTLPLIALAVPSVVLGAITIGPMLFGDVFKGVIHVDAVHPAMATLAAHYHGALALALHSVQTVPFWLALSGVGLSAYFYLMKPSIPQAIQARFAALHHVMEQKYFMDRFNEVVFAGGARLLGTQLWKRTDQGLIDGFMVNGSARVVAAVASIMRIGQSGYLYHYAIAMILGVALLLWWFAPVMVSSTAMVK